MGRFERILGVWVAIGVLAAGLVLLPGCGSDRDPNQPLTTDEGAALLREIRKDRGRMQKLTPAEKKYLAGTVGG